MFHLEVSAIFPWNIWATLVCPRTLRWKSERLTRIHFFPLNAVELFPSQVLFLFKVTHHFLGPSVDKCMRCCSPTLVGMATGSSIFSTMTMAILVYSHSASHSFALFVFPLLSSIDNVFFVLPRSYLSLPLFPNLHHPLFFCPPFFWIWPHCGAQFSLSVCLSLQAIKIAIVCFYYIIQYITLNSKKSRGICIWIRL